MTPEHDEQCEFQLYPGAASCMCEARACHPVPRPLASQRAAAARDAEQRKAEFCAALDEYASLMRAVESYWRTPPETRAGFNTPERANAARERVIALWESRS